MLTSKVRISSVSDLETLKRCVHQGTGLFYKLYNNAELMADKAFKNELISERDMIDVSMYDFTVDGVKTKLNQCETQRRKKAKEISDIEKILSDENLNCISRKKRYSLINKLATMKRNINKDCCFGGKALLRDITKHSQLANNRNGNLTDGEVLENKRIYESGLAEFRDNRRLGVYLIGRANEGGNRKVDFDLANNRIVFKPNRKSHIEIKFTDRRKELFTKLQAFADSKSIPITVRITEKYIHFSYDEALLSGYAFNETEYWKTIKKNNITTKEGRKEVTKQFHGELELKKLVGKLLGRFSAVDINPMEIGLVIGDKLSDNKEGDFKILFKYSFNLQNLCEKKGLASDSDKQKSYNEKRKFEIREIWKLIFIICTHYGVFNFVSEDLNFKTNHKKETNVEFNRQVRNIWHRELTTKLINKWVNIHGIKHIEVNPAYSSFIGNFIYNDYDPIAAATELLRRGMVKYIKGSSLYPDLRSINGQKLTYLACENVPCQNTSTWVGLYKQVSRAGLRYRNRDLETFSREGINYHLSSHKSTVKIMQCL